MVVTLRPDYISTYIGYCSELSWRFCKRDQKWCSCRGLRPLWINWGVLNSTHNFTTTRSVAVAQVRYPKPQFEFEMFSNTLTFVLFFRCPELKSSEGCEIRKGHGVFPHCCEKLRCEVKGRRGWLNAYYCVSLQTVLSVKSGPKVQCTVNMI